MTRQYLAQTMSSRRSHHPLLANRLKDDLGGEITHIVP
jgi:hypothetical protein